MTCVRVISKLSLKKLIMTGGTRQRAEESRDKTVVGIKELETLPLLTVIMLQLEF